jgi:hypothetical protein
METTPQEKARRQKLPLPRKPAASLSSGVRLLRPTTPAEAVRDTRDLHPRWYQRRRRRRPRGSSKEEEERRYREELAAREGPASPDTHLLPQDIVFHRLIHKVPWRRAFCGTRRSQAVEEPLGL